MPILSGGGTAPLPIVRYELTALQYVRPLWFMVVFPEMTMREPAIGRGRKSPTSDIRPVASSRTIEHLPSVETSLTRPVIVNSACPDVW